MLLQSAHHVCSSLTSLSSPSNTRLLKYACSAAFSFLPGSMLVARTGPGAHRCAVIMSGDVPNTPHSPASFRRNNVSLSCIRPQPGAGYDVCVIGGGIAGATAALQLARRGCLVTLVDMGKDRPGGRTSTRRVRDTDLQFDHGSQLFRCTHPQMAAMVQEWVRAGVAAEYTGRVGAFECTSGAFTPREQMQPQDLAQDRGFFGVLEPGPLYCGTPSMDTLVQYMTSAHAGIQVYLNTRVHKAKLSQGKWHLSGERVVVRPTSASGSPSGSSGGAPTPAQPSLQPTITDSNLGTFDAVVFADGNIARQGSPGVITFDGQVPPTLQSLLSSLSALERECLFTLMVAWDSPTPMLPFDGASLRGSKSIAYIANNTTKPGRGRSDSVQEWVAITRPDYARSLLGGLSLQGVLPPQTPDYIAKKAQEMWSAFQRDMTAAVGIRPMGRPRHMSAHRWGSSRVVNPLGVPTVADDEARFAACGDFCLGPGVEAAVLSGLAAADALQHMFLRLQQQQQQQQKKPTFEVTAVGNNGDCAGAGPAAASS